jgi:uncharacterized protein DUF4112
MRVEAIRRRDTPDNSADRWSGGVLPLDADIEFLAGILDDRFRIPGTNIRFGLDAIIGLIPGVGDAISATLSSYLIWRAHQLGVSKLTLLRMAGNTAVDTVVGAVPLLGDVIDVSFRANRRNLELLRRQMMKKRGLSGESYGARL